MELALSCMRTDTCVGRHITDVLLIYFSILSRRADSCRIQWVGVARHGVLWYTCDIRLGQYALDLNLLKSSWSVLESASLKGCRSYLWAIEVLTWMWLLTLIQIAASLSDHMRVLHHRVRLCWLCVYRFHGGALICSCRDRVLYLRLLEVSFRPHTMPVLRSQDRF